MIIIPLVIIILTQTLIRNINLYFEWPVVFEDNICGHCILITVGKKLR